MKENISIDDPNNPIDPDIQDPENPTLMYTTLDSISIKNLPIKTIYSLNESFDPTGLEITATYTETYSDWTTQSKNVDITYPNNMISLSEVDMSTEGTKTITLTFTEDGSSLTCTFQVTVINPSVFTYSDNAVVNSNSYKKGDNITIEIPAIENGGNTTVNIAKLYEQYTEIANQVGENGSVAIFYGNAATTTIEGELYMNDHLNMNAVNENRYANIKSFVNAIKSSVLNSDSYPTMNMQMPSRTMSDATPFNLYHTDIADLLNLYYNNDMGEKISSFSVSSSAEFDALEYLESKGGVAYDNQNNYVENSLYNLNVNAALLMNGVSLKNVNVTGELKDDFFVASTLTNTRFNFSNPNSKEFKFWENVAGIGLIEFAGDAPSVTPRVNAGRLVLKKVNSDTLIPGGFSLDVSALSANDIANSSISTSGISAGTAFAETIYGTTEAKNAAAVISSSVRVGNDLVSGIDYYYATNQQWVKAANENKWIELEGGVKYPDVSNLSAKLNLDEKNNTLLNTILFYNQKVYG